VSAEDAILSREVFILEQEFLIGQPGDVSQQPRPFFVWHEEHPSETRSAHMNILTTRDGLWHSPVDALDALGSLAARITSE
jgi:hypothetical protein